MHNCYFFGMDDNRIQKYDISRNEWDILNVRTTFNTIESRAIAYFNQIYIIGGRCQGHGCGQINIFHVNGENIVVPNGTLHTNRTDPSLAYGPNGNLYVIGGGLVSENSGITAAVEYASMTQIPTSVIPTSSPTLSPTIYPKKHEKKEIDHKEAIILCVVAMIVLFL